MLGSQPENQTSTGTMQSAHGRAVLVTGSALAGKAAANLEAHGLQAYYCKPYATPEDIAKLAAELQIEGLIVRQGQIDETVIAASPRLKVIAKHGTGVNNIDLDAAARLGIPVLRALGANARSVAEHAIALSIALLKDLVPLDRAVKGGEWPKASYVGRDLAGAVIGLVGFGAIGQEVASLARALGMSVTVFDPYTAELPEEVQRETELDALLATSDIVSLHCPLTKETRHLINGERLARMKPSAFLVNTARGEIVDEAALVEALRNGTIAGAGLDSFAEEPPPKDSPLWSLPNIIATPHTGGAAIGGMRAMAETSARHIISVLDGNGPDLKSVANPAFQAAASTTR
ncbi:hydroxyacid dehydrogenase [Microvirga aerophila]|uniref:2-hydroxyacid dehydrogenase n=1 Tax=Microvirga aerophila TaxID=670291 RepID=A0A512BQU2_9HYPH|nr:hydroxyacid dehydrogenase [Microvirga aerophila]GEO14396.1 2-hydroxyacid dehydrogenase [Microvirga aerophila]